MQEEEGIGWWKEVVHVSRKSVRGEGFIVYSSSGAAFEFVVGAYEERREETGRRVEEEECVFARSSRWKTTCKQPNRYD